MSRYGPEHKQRTRARLLERARGEFRQHGFDRASIDKLMKSADLTRGAFYAHFDSKEELVHEVLRAESGLARELREAAQEPDPGPALVAAFERYLDPRKREDLIYCPLVAHGMDARRGGQERRQIYDEQLRAILAALRQAKIRSADAHLIATLAIGAAQLSASVADEKLAASLMRGALKELRQKISAALG